MIRLTYIRNGEEYSHPFNGAWEKEYNRAVRSAKQCGTTCKYDGPESMAREYAWTKSDAPDIEKVFLEIGGDLCFSYTEARGDVQRDIRTA